MHDSIVLTKEQIDFINGIYINDDKTIVRPRIVRQHIKLETKPPQPPQPPVTSPPQRPQPYLPPVTTTRPFPKPQPTPTPHVVSFTSF
ncbi:hypothetical protein RR46_00194 [Papilio xuthus]|uniref:Uncharacterized protein n=1 Tax=Papilio xuthus TaxID=66420 RepID=A0A0N1IMR8_PAPXU|nr:hypothetical protein RR46_00194 [Papilio xuthus]